MMKKFGKQKPSVKAEDLIELSAKRAAREAAEFHVEQVRKSESSIGTFAIYAWAFFAFSASGIAGGTAYLNTLKEQPEFMAAVLKPAQPSLPLQDVDPMTTASVKKWVEQDGPIAVTPVEATPAPLGVIMGGYNPLEAVSSVYQGTQDNLELDLTDTEPLVRFRQEGEEFRAALVLGPFDSLSKATSFCAKAHTSCEVSAYSGDPLFAD
ncbi:hypothetical protein ACFQ14_16130 [Pseudahrensia aquimaris]|uniref:SPOR domain-containing protein n=1 Tax=Pseudahrensia aquimaris TaxID=744461 RepID=A0ABW3FHH5_9HYPH